MARDVDDVVHAAGDLVVAVGVADGAVSGEVEAAVGSEVGVEVALMAAVDCACHARPRLLQAQRPRHVAARQLAALR